MTLYSIYYLYDLLYPHYREIINPFFIHLRESKKPATQAGIPIERGRARIVSPQACPDLSGGACNQWQKGHCSTIELRARLRYP